MTIPGYDNPSSLVNRPISVSLFPNPTSKELCISYTLTNSTNVYVAIYNTSGQLVRSFTGNSVTWDGTNAHGSKVEAGTYLVKTVADGKVFCRKVILTK